MLILGTICIVLFLTALIATYHRFMQEQYEECIRQEFEERYDRDLELRWKAQNIRIHGRLVITDEMKGR